MIVSRVTIHRGVRVAAGILLASCMLTPAGFAAEPREPQRGAASGTPRVSAERSGALTTHDGLKLTLTADTGNVRVFTDAAGEVRYGVRVEAEAGDAGSALVREFSLAAQNTSVGISLTGRMPAPRDSQRVWVTYEVHVPRRYNLAISSRAGDITTQDIEGTIALSTGGGNIEAGRVGYVDVDPQQARASTERFAARLDTAGGHITIGDVAGGLRASTGGGHITAGNIAGDAVLHSAGGNLQAGSVAGSAQLTTGGGNIVAERTSGTVEAESAGGRIEFAEAVGAIHARTGGGGIRIARVTGPTELNSSDGGVVLAGVEAPLRASAATGGITASLSPRFGGRTRASVSALSELTAGEGDIIVYLPRQVSVTIDALIAHGADGRITADPALPLEVSYEEAAGGRALHGRCVINGGGETLHLRAMAGNIHLRFLDASKEQQPAKMRGDHVPEGAIAVKQSSEAPSERAERNASRSWWHGTWWQDFWWGGVRVDPDEEQKRLSHAVAPEYPDAARQAGIEGDVTMRVVVGPDGTVNGLKLLSGDPALARAAMESVAQWHYVPALLDGWPVSVVTTVTVAFRLH